jgi:hypothetical protein
VHELEVRGELGAGRPLEKYRQCHDEEVTEQVWNVLVGQL